MVFALEFPPVSHLIEWPDIWLSGDWAINKVVLLMGLATLLVGGFFVVGGRNFQLVPSGTQNLAESVVDFIKEGIVHQTIGPDGMRFLPFLMTLFSFIFVLNVFEVIPLIQMPVTARMALPLFMTLLVYVLYHYLGIRHQGLIGYFKGIMFPPGVPVVMYLLVSPIELVTYLFVRPLSLAVRLFANLLAGHLILVSFAVLSTALWDATYVGAAAPAALLVALTGFEVLVSVLQAYIFTILTAVYIGGALHPDH